jgi:hypothetical protein
MRLGLTAEAPGGPDEALAALGAEDTTVEVIRERLAWKK